MHESPFSALNRQGNVAKKVLAILPFVLVILPAVCFSAAGEYDQDVQPVPYEKQYEELISEALYLHVKADSLMREVAEMRKEIARLERGKRRNAEKKILELEEKAFRIQRETDEKYAQARDVELKLITARKKASERYYEEEDYPEVSFLNFGNVNAAGFISENAWDKAESLEKDYRKANSLMEEFEGFKDRIEENRRILEGDPRWIVRRRTQRETEELKEKALKSLNEALTIFEMVNFMRSKAFGLALQYARHNATDASLITKGLAYEEKASALFARAGELRQTTGSLESLSYLEEYLMTACENEMEAFGYQQKAWEIYTTSLKDPEYMEASAASEYGFEILPSSPYSPENPIPFDIALPEGLIYRIQIGVYMAPMGERLFGGITPLTGEYVPGRKSYKYYAGMFSSVADAERALLDVRGKGFRDAFIVATYSGRSIPLSRAANLEKTAGDRLQPRESALKPAEASEHVPEQKKEQPLPKVPLNQVFFSVQVGVFSEMINTETHRFFRKAAGSETLEQRKNKQGYYVYSIGNFNTFEEALLMQKQVNAQGLTDAFVVAYKGEERITVEEARQIIEQ